MSKKIVKKEKKVVPVKKVEPLEAKKEVPLHLQERRLSSEEMNNIELFNAELHQAIAEKSAQEQYKRNKILEMENMELKIKLLMEDMHKEDALIAQKTQKVKSIEINMAKYIESVKSRYGLKANGELKYDRMTGKIVD
jgi:hypothetical protein